LRSPLKHHLTLRRFTHKNPLSTTLSHYIEKYRHSQAGIEGFSLFDKELAHKVKKNNTHKKTMDYEDKLKLFIMNKPCQLGSAHINYSYKTTRPAILQALF